MLVPRKLFSLLAGGALTATLVVTGATSAAAAGNATCAGGSVASGTYSSLTIAGLCSVDSGDVTVQGNLTLAANAGLDAAENGSNLHIGGNLFVESGAILVLGCEPQAFPCFNDPNGQTGGTPGFQTHDTVGRNLVGDGALMILAHANRIGGNVTQSGGGGGVRCDQAPFGPNGPPAYTTYEDNTIGGNAIIDGLHTCWTGFFRNDVKNVNWDNNITWDGTPEFSFSDTLLHGDEDGNEIANNTVHGNLNCFDNFPAIQFGDSGGTPNTVSGKVHGQCTAVV